MSSTIAEGIITMGGVAGIGITEAGEWKSHTGVSARVSSGVVTEEKDGLLSEIASGRRPVPWLNTFVREDALERISRAAWIDPAWKPRLLRHVARTPDYAVEYPTERRLPIMCFRGHGGLAVSPYSHAESPTGYVYLLCRDMAWHYGTAEDGLLAEMRSGLGPVPWKNRTKQEEAVLSMHRDLENGWESYSGPIDDRTRKALIRHVLNTPYY